MARRTRLIAAGGLAATVGAALAQRAHMRRIADDPERELLEQPLEGRSLSIRSADGTELHAEEFGLPDGQTIVLVPGWTETIQFWTLIIRELKDEFRIVAYDLRGHGDSEPAPGDDYSMPRFGEDVEAVLAAVLPEGQRAVVAGHSLGGMSIASWAEHHDVGARASGAALLFTGVGELIGEQLLVQVPPIAKALNETIARHGFLGSKSPLPRFSTPLSAAIVRYTAFGPTGTPAQIAFYERMLIACAPAVRAAVGLAMADMNLYHALERLTVPTLVMAGANDRLTPPSHARRVAAELPRSELVELPDTGHMGPLERPREVAAALKKLATESLESAAASTRG